MARKSNRLGRSQAECPLQTKGLNSHQEAKFFKSEYLSSIPKNYIKKSWYADLHLRS